MNVQKINKTNFYPPHPGGSSVPGGGGLRVKISKVREISRTAEKIDKKNSAAKITKTFNPHPTPIRRGGGGGRGENFKVECSYPERNRVIRGREGRRQGRIGERGERDERGRETGREGLERSRDLYI